MGKQVRFYMMQEDEQEFLDFVFQRPTVKLLRVTSDTPDFIIKRTVLTDPPAIRKVFIWDSTFDFNTKDVKKIYYNKYDEDLGIYVETEKAYFAISNSSAAPFIEYSRSFLRADGKFQQGRIWAEMYRAEGDKMVPKEPGFIAWYDEIAHWLRRNLKRDKEFDAYVAKHASEWRNRGGEFH